MSLTERRCPKCNRTEIKPQTTYTVTGGEQRTIYHCQCGNYFSETKNTPLEGLKTPLSRISMVLEATNDGLGLNAACRTFHVGKNSIKRWGKRLGGLKETLLVYALCHQFIQQWVESDEFYTRVKQNQSAAVSEGWTVVLMDRASRFIWEIKCGQREAYLFTQAMETLSQVIQQTADVTLFTDGERRYGNTLFDICQQVVRTGKVGHPKKHYHPV